MTFAMLGYCRRTGEIGMAAATCSIATGARIAHRVVAGDREWVLVSLARARPGLGFEAADALATGVGYGDLAAALARQDPYLAYRQLGVLERHGPCFVYSGPKADDWKGHVETHDGLAIGNYLADGGVVRAMADRFAADTEAPLAERLIRALEGGRDSGGQADETGAHEPELSSFVRVFNGTADPYVYGKGRSAVIDLRIDFDIDAVGALRRLHEDLKPMRAAYELRARDPEGYFKLPIAGWEKELFERCRSAAQETSSRPPGSR